MVFGLNRAINRMAASAAILLSTAGRASAEVCGHVYDFDYSGIAPVNAVTEFLLLASGGPIGGLIVFFTGLYLATSKPGVLLGLAAFLGILAVASYQSHDPVFDSFMIRGGCAAENSMLEPVFMTAAVLVFVLALFRMRRSKPESS
jgi:hypothetical protein